MFGMVFPFFIAYLVVDFRGYPPLADTFAQNRESSLPGLCLHCKPNNAPAQGVIPNRLRLFELAILLTMPHFVFLQPMYGQTLFAVLLDTEYHRTSQRQPIAGGCQG